MRQAVRVVFTRPEYQWVERHQPLQWLFQAIARFFDWLRNLSDSHPVGSTVLAVFASVLLLALLAHIGYTLWRALQPAGRGNVPAGAAGVVYDAEQYLARAEQLAREGRFTEALGARFLAVILELDRAAALRFHASKTPAEYMNEIHLDSTGRESFHALVARLYRHLFGALPCDEAEYREFGAVAQELTRHVVPA